MLASTEVPRKSLLASSSTSCARRARPIKCKPSSTSFPEQKPCWQVKRKALAAFSMGGIMGAGTKMMAAGLSMGQVQAVTRETIAYAREKIGDDAVGEIVGAIPGLSQFV